MSTENVKAALDKAEESGDLEGLRETLASHPNEQEIIDAVIEIGKKHDCEFTPDDVEQYVVETYSDTDLSEDQLKTVAGGAFRGGMVHTGSQFSGALNAFAGSMLGSGGPTTSARTWQTDATCDGRDYCRRRDSKLSSMM